MAVSHKPGGIARVRSTASAGLHLAMQKCMSVLSDFDPMLQIWAAVLIIKLAAGFTWDRETVVATGMLAMMLFEELV